MEQNLLGEPADVYIIGFTVRGCVYYTWQRRIEWKSPPRSPHSLVPLFFLIMTGYFMVILLITKLQRCWGQLRALLQILCSHLKNASKYLCPHCIQTRPPQQRNTRGNSNNGTFLANRENRFMPGHRVGLWWCDCVFARSPLELNDKTQRRINYGWCPRTCGPVRKGKSHLNDQREKMRVWPGAGLFFISGIPFMTGSPLGRRRRGPELEGNTCVPTTVPAVGDEALFKTSRAIEPEDSEPLGNAEILKCYLVLGYASW